MLLMILSFSFKFVFSALCPVCWCCVKPNKILWNNLGPIFFNAFMFKPELLDLGIPHFIRMPLWIHRPSPNIRGSVPNRAAPKKAEPNRYRGSKPSGNTPDDRRGRYAPPGRAGDRGRDQKGGKDKKKVCDLASFKHTFYLVTVQLQLVLFTTVGTPCEHWS